MNVVNPAMVVLAREARAMSAKELADAAGISPSKQSKYENGLLPIIDEDLDIGLGSSLLFNHRLKTTPIGVQRQVQARVNIVRLQLERMLRAVEISNEATLPRIDVDECNGDARLVARRVRAAMRMPMGPVQNMTRAIESAGGVG